MEYNKPALTYEEQADQLLKRGLKADRSFLIEILKNVNYYRLSGYWYPFRNFPDDTFLPNTELTTIWRRYTFDRQLRLLILDGIERIEISLRTSLTYEIAHEFGAFDYQSQSTLPNLNETEFQKLITNLHKEYGKSKEPFSSHFQKKYGDSHDCLPIWMITEIITFGTLFTFYRGISKKSLKRIAKLYNLNGPVLLSWVGTLNVIRNICAHHGRLWNRELGYKPILPDQDAWSQLSNNRIFSVLTIIKYSIDLIAKQSSWSSRLYELLQKYTDVPSQQMGFPNNWQELTIWKEVHS